MKKILLFVALLGAAGVTHAEWSQVGHSAKDMTLYVDHESRADSGHGTVVMWHLTDYAVMQEFEGRKFLSMKGQDEYDCSKDLSRELLHFWHPDPMGNSQMVHAVYKPTPWVQPEAGSLQRALMQLACKKK